MELKKELQEKYKEIYGKSPFGGWDVEELQKRISEKDSESYDDFDIDPNQTYEFELQRNKEAKHIIETEAVAWDEKTQKIRNIRYCKTEESVFVDEQSDFATRERETIMFTSPILRVSGQDRAKIKYLLMYDSNGDKKQVCPKNIKSKNLYRLRNKENESRLKLEQEENIFKAKEVVNKADFEELSNFMRSRFNISSTDKAELRAIAYEKAKQAPVVFRTEFNNPKNKIKADIQISYEKGIIVVDNSNVNYKSTGALITTFNPNRFSYDEAMARWVMEGSKEAKDFYKQIQEKI